MKRRFKGTKWKLVLLGWELFISTYGATLAAAESVYFLYPLARLLDVNLSFHRFNQVLSVPYFPFQIAAGFTIGYLGQKRFGTPFSCWLWMAPFSNLMWHFFAYEPGVFANRWLSRFDHFVGSGCRPPCSDQLVYTAPLYASIAYGLGTLANEKLGGADKLKEALNRARRSASRTGGRGHC
jgi:hypothetical protein